MQISPDTLSMRITRAVVVGLTFLAVFAGGPSAGAQPAAQTPTPSSLPASTQFDFTSQINGRPYRVRLAEIKPRIAALAKVDPTRSILWGHSLGGLFVLHTLFNHPDAFQTDLAQSPSIWWDSKAVLRGEAAFSAAVERLQIGPRVFIGVGGKEQDLPDFPASTPAATVAKARQAVVDAAMVDNARALAARLAALKGGPDYRVASQVFAAQSHMSVPYAALNVVLDFALPVRPAK